MTVISHIYGVDTVHGVSHKTGNAELEPQQLQDKKRLKLIHEHVLDQPRSEARKVGNEVSVCRLASYPDVGPGLPPSAFVAWSTYSAFPSSCNIRLQEREPCHPIKLQKDLNSALWLAHTVDAVATGSCKNLEKRCTASDPRWGCLGLGTRLGLHLDMFSIRWQVVLWSTWQC